MYFECFLMVAAAVFVVISDFQGVAVNQLPGDLCDGKRGRVTEVCAAGVFDFASKAGESKCERDHKKKKAHEPSLAPFELKSSLRACLLQLSPKKASQC